MINKKGSLVLRDVVFMMLIVSSIFIFASIFIGEMGTNYDNTNMTDEWVGSNIYSVGNSTFYNTGGNIEDVGDSLGTGIWDLISNSLTSIGNVLEMIITAPNTLSNLMYYTLIDSGVSPSLANVVYFLVLGILWAVIAFTIYSAFLQGGKL